MVSSKTNAFTIFFNPIWLYIYIGGDKLLVSKPQMTRTHTSYMVMQCPWQKVGEGGGEIGLGTRNSLHSNEGN